MLTFSVTPSTYSVIYSEKICPLFGQILIPCLKCSRASFLPSSYSEKMRWGRGLVMTIAYLRDVPALVSLIAEVCEKGIKLHLKRYAKTHFYPSNYQQNWYSPALKDLFPEVFYNKDVENFVKLTGKHLCPSLFFNKTATLLKKRLWHSCFPMNFAKLLGTPFFREHL